MGDLIMQFQTTVAEAKFVLEALEQNLERNVEEKYSKEGFADKVRAMWPDILRNYHFQDFGEIMQVRMFLLGVEYGIQTVARRGGLARVRSQSPKVRSASARKAAKARWAKRQ